MKPIRNLIILLVLIGCTSDNPEKISISQQEKDIIYQKIKSFPSGTQFSIAIIKNNKTEFSGYQIADDTILTIENKDSVFEIGSMTKVFTSAILANLVVENKLKLDDKIVNTLPVKLNNTEKNALNISYKTLANHTSGLPAYPNNFKSVAEENPSNPFSEYDSLLLLSYLEQDLTLSSEPGKAFQYSNLGYSILGYLLEYQTGKNYEELLQQYISQKYTMMHTTIDKKKIQYQLVKGHNEKGEEIPNMDFNIFRGAGAIFSSADDLAKFVKANFTNDSALYLQRQLTFSDHSNNLSLGWLMYWNCGCTPFYWYFHNGGTLGYRSSIWMDTKAKSAVIVLSNSSVYSQFAQNVDQMGWELLRNQYRSGDIDYEAYCEAPFIESALEKGWGTKINNSISQIEDSDNPIIGVWQKPLPNKVITRTFTPDFKTQTDFYGDEEIDVWGYYEVIGDTIVFKDMGGVPCDFEGIYKFKLSNDSLQFELINDDECDGRVREMGGSWTRIKNKY